MALFTVALTPFYRTQKYVKRILSVLTCSCHTKERIMKNNLYCRAGKIQNDIRMIIVCILSLAKYILNEITNDNQ